MKQNSTDFQSSSHDHHHQTASWRWTAALISFQLFILGEFLRSDKGVCSKCCKTLLEFTVYCRENGFSLTHFGLPSGTQRHGSNLLEVKKSNAWSACKEIIEIDDVYFHSEIRRFVELAPSWKMNGLNWGYSIRSRSSPGCHFSPGMFSVNEWLLLIIPLKAFTKDQTLALDHHDQIINHVWMFGPQIHVMMLMKNGSFFLSINRAELSISSGTLFGSFSGEEKCLERMFKLHRNNTSLMSPSSSSELLSCCYLYFPNWPASLYHIPSFVIHHHRYQTSSGFTSINIQIKSCDRITFTCCVWTLPARLPHE